MKKFFFFILGIYLCSYGLTYIIIYLNLLSMGFSIVDYLKYLLVHAECLVIFLGIILILLAFKKGKNS